jgi:hypothetical protein
MSVQRAVISIHLDEKARRRVEKAAGLLDESSDAFLGQVGDQVARRIVLDWAVREYRRGERTFGELAEETGLWIEEIMTAMADHRPEDDAGVESDMDAKASGAHADPALYRAVEQVTAALRERLPHS